MFDKVQLLAARAMFALVVAMSLGFGVLIAGGAVILGLLMVAAFRIAMIGAGREPRNRSADRQAPQQAEPEPQAQTA